MESMQSVRQSIAAAKGAVLNAKGGVLVLMQEGTDEQGISDEWADLMFEAYELLKMCDDVLDAAELT